MREAVAQSSRSAREPTQYASVRAMAEWFAGARPGNEMSYATGAGLDPREPARLLAGEWQQRGAAVLFQRRGDDGKLRYFARKVRPAQAVVAVAARRPADDAEWEASEQGRVYRLLCRCANLGQPCPSNQAIADRLELRDRHRAKYLIEQLLGRGLIRLEAAAKLGPRVVRVVASGKVTPEVSG